MRTAAERFFRMLATSALVSSAMALAQEKPANYPTRPIRMILAVAPGAGIDTTSRAVVSFLVGKRTAENAHALARDLRSRVLGRVFLSSDQLLLKAFPSFRFTVCLSVLTALIRNRESVVLALMNLN